MSEVRRRLVRFLILLLPALLLLAAVYAARGDLRDAAARSRKPRYVFDGNSFDSSRRKDELGPWTSRFIARLSEFAGIYGFKKPAAGFSIDVNSEQGSTRYVPGSNHLVIWGFRDDAGIQRELSRLITRAMLWEGSPKAEFSPWFVEGVSRFYEGTDAAAVGSRKDPLLRRAAENPPTSLADALSARENSPNFDAVSHSLVAFMHAQYAPEKIAQYASEERKPGRVPPGTFERIFGPDFEKAWLEDLARR